MLCNEFLPKITLLLDGELQEDDLSMLEHHLSQCGSCRERVAIEQRFLETIRSAKPIHLASDELRVRVQKIVDADQPLSSSEPQQTGRLARALQIGTLRGLKPRWGVASLQFLSLAALLVMATAVATWLLPKPTEHVPFAKSSAIALMAADTHRRYLNGQLPLEISSARPEQISGWFAGKVPFQVQLPDYQEQSGQIKLYQLEGARLVSYQNDYAAYVAYQMYQRPISLIVTSNAVALPAGGEQITARGLTFHYDVIYGFKVLTWSDRGLTYALVSELGERGQQSCIVCHQGTRDQELIDGLKPKA